MKQYKEEVEKAVKYVIQNKQDENIYHFVTGWQKFQEIGEDIIFGFNSALALWKKYIIATGISPSVFDEGMQAYQKRLRECRTKIEELLTEFKDLQKNLDIYIGVNYT